MNRTFASLLATPMLISFFATAGANPRFTASAQTTGATAQTASAPKATAEHATMLPPVAPLMVYYEFWPVQYVQFVGNELPYSMVMLNVQPGKKPVYRLTLIDRKTQKGVVYSNNDGIVMLAKARGGEAYKTSIAVDGADSDSNGSITTVRMALADGRPLQWRFVQGSDVSEQGSGMSPVPGPVPTILYREQAAVAGEGTALQVGDVVSTADVWTEISHPPYFVAYRGTMSENVHTAVLLTGKQKWTVASSPAELKPGTIWLLSGEAGQQLTLKIDKVDGAHVTLTGESSMAPGTRFSMNATHADQGWTVDRMRWYPVDHGDKHYFAMDFPAAPATALDLYIGKKKIASGSMSLSGDPSEKVATVTLETPKSLKGKSLREQTLIHPNSIEVVAMPAEQQADASQPEHRPHGR